MTIPSPKSNTRFECSEAFRKGELANENSYYRGPAGEHVGRGKVRPW